MFFAPALAFLAAAASPAAAQTVIGSQSQPAVTVDQSVLDALGPPPTLPELLRGKASQRRTALAPGAERHKRSSAHPGPRKKALAAKKKPAVAAHPAAPVAPVATTAPATPPGPRDSLAATPVPAPAPAPAAPAAPAPAAAPAEPAAAPAAAPPAATPEAAPAPAPAAVAEAAKPPTASPPGPVPMASPSPAAAQAMNTPPALPPEPAIPATPAAAPAAAVPPASGERTRILFGTGAADLPDSAKIELDALVQRLHADDQSRLQLVAHASGTADQSNQARRVSLQRALAVRSYLMERGIANTRMDVRALGNRSDGSSADPLDRVDVIMLEH